MLPLRELISRSFFNSALSIFCQGDSLFSLEKGCSLQFTATFATEQRACLNCRITIAMQIKGV
jgi:hypothetical protein